MIKQADFHLINGITREIIFMMLAHNIFLPQGIHQEERDGFKKNPHLQLRKIPRNFSTARNPFDTSSHIAKRLTLKSTA